MKLRKAMLMVFALVLVFGLSSTVMAANNYSKLEYKIGSGAYKVVPTEAVVLPVTTEDEITLTFKATFSSDGDVVVDVTNAAVSPLALGDTSVKAITYAASGTAEQAIKITPQAGLFSGTVPSGNVSIKFDDTTYVFKVVDDQPKLVTSWIPVADKTIAAVANPTGAHGYFAYGLKDKALTAGKLMAKMEIEVTDSEDDVKKGFYAGVSADKLKVQSPKEKDKLNTKVAKVSRDKVSGNLVIQFTGLGSSTAYLGTSATEYTAFEVSCSYPEVSKISAHVIHGKKADNILKSAPPEVGDNRFAFAEDGEKALAFDAGDSYQVALVYTSSVIDNGDTYFLVGKKPADNSTWVMAPAAHMTVKAGTFKATGSNSQATAAELFDAFGRSMTVNFTINDTAKDKSITVVTPGISSKNKNTATIEGTTLTVPTDSVGKPVTLEVKGQLGTDASKAKALKPFWYSDNPADAVVDQKGNVTVLKAGANAKIGYILPDLKGGVYSKGIARVGELTIGTGGSVSNPADDITASIALAEGANAGNTGVTVTAADVAIWARVGSAKLTAAPAKGSTFDTTDWTSLTTAVAKDFAASANDYVEVVTLADGKVVGYGFKTITTAVIKPTPAPNVPITIVAGTQGKTSVTVTSSATIKVRIVDASAALAAPPSVGDTIDVTSWNNLTSGTASEFTAAAKQVVEVLTLDAEGKVLGYGSHIVIDTNIGA